MTAGDMAYVVMTLAGVLAIFFACVLLFRNVKKKLAPQGDLAIRETLYLDNKRRVCVVGYQNSEFVVLLSPTGDHVLSAIPKAAQKEKDDDHLGWEPHRVQKQY